MLILESRLRKLIKEELQSTQVLKQILPAVKKTVKAAIQYETSLKSGSRDTAALEEIRDSIVELNTIVQLLRKNRAPEASSIATLARLATELMDASKFWKTPVVLGKQKHINAISDYVKRMRDVAERVVASARAGTSSFPGPRA